MDMERIGKFLAQLRREQGLTQEELGEQVGVTNKTVSRWETGSYMPPVEALLALSQLYGVSINELLSGQRLDDAQFKEKAEENVAGILRQSAFSTQERLDFFKKKWKKEHRFSLVLELLALVAMLVVVNRYDLGPLSNVIPAFAVAFIIGHRRNQMMAFAESCAFSGYWYGDGSTEERI